MKCRIYGYFTAKARSESGTLVRSLRFDASRVQTKTWCDSSSL